MHNRINILRRVLFNALSYFVRRKRNYENF
nr:MAG TPA: hypothetical protein [Caudoviricetes sp.]